MQIFISHVARWLRTRRFSEPTFRPSGPQIIGKKQSVSRLFYLFARLHLLSSGSLFSDLLSADSFSWRAINFWFCFRGRFWIFFWVPGSMLSCFSDFLLFCFSAFLLFLLFCFSAFPASLLFCFSAFAFPASLLFLLLCFSAFCFSCFSAFLLLCFPCFSAFVLLCLSTSTILLFLFFSHVFLLLYFQLLCFLASCLYCLFVFHFLVFILFRLYLGETQRNPKEILIRHPT